MFTKSKKVLLGLVAAALMLSGCASDDSEAGDGEGTPTADSSFPERPITIIVPYAAGGGVDLTARILASHLPDHIGTRVVVQNVEGGGGATGFTEASNADPDGYTLLLGATPMVHHEYLREGEITYSRDSFEPIYSLTDVPHTLFVTPETTSEPDQLIQELKDEPESIVMGVGGQWATMDVSRAIMEQETGVRFKRVVYDGGADVIGAMLSGDVQAGMFYADEAAEQMRAGNLVPVATAAEKPLEAEGFEDVPTFTELGYDVVSGTWRGILAPAGTPEEVLSVIEDAIEATIEDPAYIAAMEDAGIPIVPSDRADFEELLDRDHAASKRAAEALLAETGK